MTLKPATDRRPRLLLVDDEPTNLQVLRQILQADYRLSFARDGDKALQLAAQERPQLILLDVMMPGLSGLEVCRRLKADPGTASIPVIFVTALADESHEAEGFAVGAVDYVTKPVSPPLVRARVRTHLSLVRVEDLKQSRLEIVQRLGRAAEYKDNETGLHVIRMSHYARLLALAVGYSEEDADELLHAAAMHDIGKIGVPDAVLLKKGPLDAEQWEVMRRHPQMGGDIIGEHGSTLLQMARRVALTHHEKWDGSGYPQGLKGEEIALEGRIVAIADVFDALTNERPYKPAWSVEQAVELLQAQAGRHFDPGLVPVFIRLLPEILRIQAQWPEKAAAALPPAA
ncbi:MAG: two-component system response regulator [Curvibacter sp.]|nr:two-component system response regulator [Curvibacter sp.]